VALRDGTQSLDEVGRARRSTGTAGRTPEHCYAAGSSRRSDPKADPWRAGMAITRRSFAAASGTSSVSALRNGGCTAPG
jgi:hypothetical protein